MPFAAGGAGDVDAVAVAVEADVGEDEVDLLRRDHRAASARLSTVATTS